MMRARRAGLATVLGALFLTGAALAAGPVGIYGTTVQGASPAVLNGAWTVSFARGGAYMIARSSGVMVRGQATVTGDRITFGVGGETGPAACRGAQARGTYRYAEKGLLLTLTPIRDPCPGRKAVLAGRPLRKR